MIRSLIIASAAVAFSLPALAEDSAAPSNDQAAVAQQEVAQVAGEVQARKHLLSQGYTAVSPLEQDLDGRWTGTATKDGKTVIVAIKVPTANAATN